MKKQKNRNLTLKLVCYLSFAALLAWLAVYCFRAMNKPYRTVPVTGCTERVTEPLSGIIAREETVLFSAFRTVHIDVEEGQRVAARGTVAQAYESPETLARANRMKELKQESEELTSLLKAASAENSQQTDAELQRGIRSLRQMVQARSFADVDEQMQIMYTWAFAAFSSEERMKERLANCEQQIAQLEREGAASAALIPAPTSGLYSSTVDGWETLTPDALRQIDVDALRTLLAEERSAPTYAMGKLVGGIRWYYAALMDAQQADRIRRQSSVQVVFGKYYGEKLTMRLEWVSPETDGVRTVLLSCDEALSEMLTARKQEAELILTEQRGMRIPRRSLHLDEKGDPCVYVKTGLQAEKKPVRVLKDYGDYYMVESDLLRVGDAVIVGGKELTEGKIIK